MFSFPETPFQVLRGLGNLLFTGEIFLEEALDAVEEQYQRVCDWADGLELLAEPHFEEGVRMHQLGIRATAGALESLERLHQALEEDCAEMFDQALNGLEQAHVDLHSALELSREIQLTAEDQNEREIFQAVKL